MDTVFRIAVLMGSVEAVEVLLLWGGDAFLADLKHNPMVLACKRGNRVIVEKLHEYGANINIKTEVSCFIDNEIVTDELMTTGG